MNLNMLLGYRKPVNFGGGILIRIFQRNRTNSRYLHVKRDLFYWIGSHYYGGWEVLRTTPSKLKTQESQWYSYNLNPKSWETLVWVQIQRLGNWESFGGSSSLRAGDLHLAQSERVNSGFLHLLFRPSTALVMSTQIRMGNLLYLVADLIPPKKPPSWIHPEIMFIQISGQPNSSWPIKLTITGTNYLHLLSWSPSLTCLTTSYH